MSSAPVNAERGDVVASRVANIQEIAIRLDAKVAGIIALRPKLLEPRGGSVGLIDRQQGDRIVQPVGGVHKPSIRRDMDFRRVVGPLVSRWQRRNCLL